jgi:hypothetical protein
MSNRFKTLDNYYPTLPKRRFGEVVSVSIRFLQGEVLEQRTYLHWKRKAWYVNASVNAFHMHRGLCREFSNENSWVSGNQLKRIKKLIGDIVEYSYLQNVNSDTQYYCYAIELDSLDTYFSESYSSGEITMFSLDQAIFNWYQALEPSVRGFEINENVSFT